MKGSDDYFYTLKISYFFSALPPEETAWSGSINFHLQFKKLVQNQFYREDLVLNLKGVHGGETLTLELNLVMFEFDSLPFL